MAMTTAIDPLPASTETRTIDHYPLVNGCIPAGYLYSCTAARQRPWRSLPGPRQSDIYCIYKMIGLTMLRSRYYVLILATLLLPLRAFAQSITVEPVVVLISEAEAALDVGPIASPSLMSANDLDDRAITRTPKILLVSPGETKIATPLMHFKIRFTAFNGAEIDTKRVRITYLKTSPVDLTPRAASFIRTDGIDIPRALVAQGKHLIRIDIADSEGRQATRILALDVGS